MRIMIEPGVIISRRLKWIYRAINGSKLWWTAVLYSQFESKCMLKVAMGKFRSAKTGNYRTYVHDKPSFHMHLKPFMEGFKNDKSVPIQLDQQNFALFQFSGDRSNSCRCSLLMKRRFWFRNTACSAIYQNYERDIKHGERGVSLTCANSISRGVFLLAENSLHTFRSMMGFCKDYHFYIFLNWWLYGGHKKHYPGTHCAGIVL